MFDDSVAKEKPKVHTSESDRVAVTTIGGPQLCGKRNANLNSSLMCGP